ncbi:MAG: hypothetical protein JWN33_182 [Candidatus Saccharibacteria bacterium]|nr:hypothetical protein [Candidatus Saccharibacteria bacterium]
MAKTAAKKRSVKRQASSLQRSLARHILAGAVSFSAHHHTGRRLTHRHTSHGALLLIVILAGIVLFANILTIKASSLTTSGSSVITAVVSGPPPSEGADIISPVNNYEAPSAVQAVEGTCPSGTLVVVYRNGDSAGSITCSTSGLFELDVQLLSGLNILQAQNYDGVNQPGPATSPVYVYYTPPVVPEAPTTPASPTTPTTAIPITPTPPAPALPDPQPATSTDPCALAPSSSENLSVSVGCIIRSSYVGETIELPLYVGGGLKPYALLVNWGDATDDVYSVSEPGKVSFKHTYHTGGVHSVMLKLVDHSNSSYQIQTVIQVSDPAAGAGSTSDLPETVRPWIEVTLPIYWTLVALVSGFWLGDIFDRFIKGSVGHKKRRHS